MGDITKVNPEIDLSWLALIAGGHNAFQLLWAGVELELFTLLSQEPGLSLEQISERLDLQHYPCRVLLVGLTALGLLKKQDKGYTNAHLVERMLVKGSPDYAGEILGWQAHIVYPGMMNFLDSLRQGTNVGLENFPGKGNTLYQRLVGHPELEQTFQSAMSSLSAQANAYLVHDVDFSRFTHVVDIGGGDGSNALALARKFPSLRVTVFDSPSVCEYAKRNIADAGLQDRVATYAGEMFSDPFPEGVDAILFSHIFTIWSLDKDLALLKKSYDTLPEGGSTLIFGMMGADDDTGPLSTALGSPYFLTIATGEGMLYSWADYEEAMRQAGFLSVERVENLPLNHGVIIGTK